MEIYKTCKRCLITKKTSEFYPHNTTKDRLHTSCRECELLRVSLQAKNRYLTDSYFLEYTKNRNKAYYKIHGKKGKPRTREQQKQDIKKYFNKYPEKYQAHLMSNKVWPTKPCHDMHHWSYNKEHYKDVIELSKASHKIIHTYMKYDQKYFMYRTLDGVLLNTKELHIDYINLKLSNQCADC